MTLTLFIIPGKFLFLYYYRRKADWKQDSNGFEWVHTWWKIGIIINWKMSHFVQLIFYYLFHAKWNYAYFRQVRGKLDYFRADDLWWRIIEPLDVSLISSFIHLIALFINILARKNFVNSLHFLLQNRGILCWRVSSFSVQL